MNEKEPKDQSVGAGTEQVDGKAGKSGGKPAGGSREDRLAEALRANLRRRKSAAKSRKDD